MGEVYGPKLGELQIRARLSHKREIFAGTPWIEEVRSVGAEPNGVT